MSYLELSPGAEAAFAARLHEERVQGAAQKIPLHIIDHEFPFDKPGYTLYSPTN